ncbi:hypothetical protein [Bartonella massiliensis]|uniref:hypothetical protein n=1 Tax=Bartonella massiliensis TaxID=929795 RepID=UPI001FE6B968|nr:hypothetical protein [Bartonella massiliensis]
MTEINKFRRVPIAAFSKSRVITENEYNQLYEKYVNEQYHYGVYDEYLKRAKLYLDAKSYGVYHVLNHDMIVLVPENVKYIHAKVVWCACLVDLLKGVYNEKLPALSLPTYIQKLRSQYNWKESDFIWAKNLVMNSTDPMFKYAQMVFDSEIFSYTVLALINEISNAEKFERDKRGQEKNYGARRIIEYPKFCNEIGQVYHIMMPDKYR